MTVKLSILLLQNVLFMTMNVAKCVVVAFLVILAIFPQCKTYKTDLDKDLFENMMFDYIVRLLKADSVQQKINQEVFDYNRYDKDRVYVDLLASVERAFLEKQQALVNLRNAALRSYTSSSRVAKQCCEVENKEYNSRFNAEVNFAEHCDELPPFYAEGEGDAVYLTRDFTDVASQNLEDYPFIKWQYFGAETGIFSQYPAQGDPELCRWFDPRTRPWYLQSVNSFSKEVVFMIDSSGSMGEFVDGVTLLSLAIEAVEILINTLTPSDKFAVVAIADEIQTISNFSKNVTCFSEELAIATTRNVEEIKTFLTLLEADGGTFYISAMREGFKYFNDSKGHTKQTVNTTADGEAERMLIFLSDGEANDPEPEILDAVSQHLMDVNGSVRVITLGIGDGDFAILEAIALLNPASKQEGVFFVLDSQETIKETMPLYFKTFDAPVDTNLPFWSIPYPDAALGNDIVTGSLPVFSNAQLIGVVGVDVILRDIISEVQVDDKNPQSYYFIVNHRNQVLLHPLLTEVHPNRIFVASEAYERDEEYLRVITALSSGINGSIQLTTPYYHLRGATSFYGTDITVQNVTYFWSKFTSIPISVVFVGVGEFKSSLSQKTVKRNTTLYSRFDLDPPKAPCWHAFTVATMEKPSIFLPRFAFANPSIRVFENWDASTVQKFIDFAEGQTSANDLGLKDIYRSDIVATSFAAELWFHRDEENDELLGDVLWRYIVTINSVVRIYPGAEFPLNYNPFARSWYRQISSQQQHDYVISTPYYDAVTGVLILTIGRTIFKPRFLNDPEPAFYGIMAMDIPLNRFQQVFINTYPFCDKRQLYRCYLIDSGGFLIVVNHWEGETWYYTDYAGRQNFRKHITEVEPEISALLIEKGIMEVQQCADVGLGARSRSYKVVPQDFSSNIETTFFDAYFFRLVNFENTNVWAIIRTLPIVGCNPGFVTCPCNIQLCHLPEEDVHNCQCPCFQRDPNYEFCENFYLNLSAANHPPCIPTDISTTYVFPKDHSDSENAPNGLEVCYPLNKFAEERIADDTILLIICCLAISLITIASLIIYARQKEATLRKSRNVIYRTNQRGSGTSLDETVRRQFELTKEEMAQHKKQHPNLRRRELIRAERAPLQQLVPQGGQGFGYRYEPESPLNALRKFFSGKSLIQRIKRNIKDYQFLKNKISATESQEELLTTAKNVNDLSTWASSESWATDKVLPLPLSPVSELSTDFGRQDGTEFHTQAFESALPEISQQYTVAEKHSTDADFISLSD